VYLAFSGDHSLVYLTLLNVDFPWRSEDTTTGPEKGVQILSRWKLEIMEVCRAGTFLGLTYLLRPFKKVASILV